MSHAETIRRLIRVLETVLPPELETYITKFPETVAADVETLMAEIKERAQAGSLFGYVVAQLPDGRFIEVSANLAQKFGLRIVQKGSSRDLAN